MNRPYNNRRIAALAGCLGLTSMLWLGLTRISVAQGASPLPVVSQSQLPPRTLLKLGSKDTDVQELQGVLALMGLYQGAIDGTFDAATRVAVVQFQQLAGLDQDGIVGAATWQKLLPPAPGEAPVNVRIPQSVKPVAAKPAPVKPQPKPVVDSTANPILRNGAEGADVSRLQRRLRALGFYKGPIDGGFGDMTEAAVKAAQRNAGLDPDGIVGPATWNAIR